MKKTLQVLYLAASIVLFGQIARADVTLSPAPLARQFYGTTFANLATPASGNVRWCSDCVATAPCAGSGSGAFAYRSGSAWNCVDPSNVTQSSTGTYTISLTTQPPRAAAGALAGAGAGNVNNGNHSLKVTFVTAAGETSGGAVSNVVPVVDKTVDGKISWAIPIGPSGIVTARKLYRTAAGGSSYLLLATLADNTTTTYTDNIADASLTTAMPTTNAATDAKLVMTNDGVVWGPSGFAQSWPWLQKWGGNSGSTSTGQYDMVLAASGDDFAMMGYDFYATSTHGVYKSQANDNVVALSFGGFTTDPIYGGWYFKTSGGGDADTTLTWTNALYGDSTQTVSNGPYYSVALKPTAGTMTATKTGALVNGWQRYDWTNAMVTALGGVTAGDVTVCTIPANVVVKNAYVVIDTPDTSANAFTVALGRTSASYIDYIVASNAKASANTVYGDASGERGTNLTGYDLPSPTGTTAIVAHFIKTTTNLSTVVGSTGHVYIETATLP